VNFCVTKGISCNLADAKYCLELSSDHSPILVTLSTKAILRVPQPRLCNRQTDCDAFHHLLNERLLLNVSLNTDSDIEAAIKNFNDIIQWSGWTTTAEHTEARQTYDCPILIKQKLLNKMRLRRTWHRFRTPESKRLLNAATRELEQLLADTNKNLLTRPLTVSIHRLLSMESGQESQTSHNFFPPTSDNTKNMGPNEH
jgi:hypothetical protein